MKIYGFDLSNPTNKVRYVANALGLKYDFEFTVPFSEHVQNDQYHTLNPVGKVPVLVDDNGFSLFESGAIVKYLDAKNGCRFYPQDIEKRAKIDQWTDFISIHIRSAMVQFFWNRVGVKYMGHEPDLNSLNEGLKFLARFLPIIDAQLGKSKYIAGDELTLADFSLLSELDGIEMCDFDLSPYPNITAWRQDLQSQDFYQVDRSRGRKLLEDRIAQNAG